MARLDPGASARWLSRRAKIAAAALKAEYDAGTRGDDTPTQPIFPTPAEQLAAISRLIAGTRGARPAGDPPPEAEDAEEVAAALRQVDWSQVRAATAERTGAAADAMRAMAREVDWAAVQPVAAQVSSALIAAVASGRLPVAGRMGPLVAKALSDRGALAQRVGVSMSRDAALPPDFRAAVHEDRGADDPDLAPLPRWERDG